MSSWPPHPQLQTALEQVERRIAGGDPEGELRRERAALLIGLGRDLDARQAYLDLLADMPTHFETLNNLGALLEQMGFVSAALSIFRETVKHHPDNPMGRINLGNLLQKYQALEEAREHFAAALRVAPDHPDAHRGMAYVLTGLGCEEQALAHREKAFRQSPVLHYLYRGSGVPIDLLLLASASGGSVPIRHHIDNRIFSTTVLFVDYFDPAAPLPPHQLIFNAIGDADICAPALEAAARIIARSSAPLINHPQAVLMTGRAANAARLAAIPGLVTPAMTLLPRERLTEGKGAGTLAEFGVAAPCLLRSPGFHTGQHFLRVERAEDLAAAAAQLPGAQLLLIQYLDARAADGKVRKYRVMAIDGRLYPVHAAVSSDWKVHYFTADMAENADHRAEDERFLESPDSVLTPNQLATLKRVAEALQLDYAGIDFGLDRSGNVLLFEANATMVINPPDRDERWTYRRAPIRRVLDAIRDQLLSRAAQALGRSLAQARSGFEAGDYAGCVALCEEAMGHFSSAPALLHLLGLARFRLGHRTSGVNLLQRALDLAPADRALRLDRARAAEEMGQGDVAIQVLAEGGRYHPGDPQLAAMLVRALLQDGRTEEARQVLESALRAAPNDEELRQLRERDAKKSR